MSEGSLSSGSSEFSLHTISEAECETRRTDLCVYGLARCIGHTVKGLKLYSLGRMLASSTCLRGGWHTLKAVLVVSLSCVELFVIGERG